MAEEAELAAVILAAGKGTRMKSDLPKVLHPALEQPLVGWTVQSAISAQASRIVAVVGYGREQVSSYLSGAFGAQVETVVQAEQRGTGHAVQCALPPLADFEGVVVILYGDCPLIPGELIAELTTLAREGDEPVAMVTGRLAEPTGYGRILRNAAGQVVAIREHRDCTEIERLITEVNPGIYAVRSSFLREALNELEANNSQGELYLTDIIARAAHAGGVASLPADMDDMLGVNDRADLALSEARLRRRVNRDLMRKGVTLRDPESTWVSAHSQVETGAILEPGVHLRGQCKVATGARIDVGCVLTDTEVHEGAYLRPYTVSAESVVGQDARVGPFAHLRPQTVLGPECRIGNFVETKKTTLGKGSKANHLAYLGDGILGEGVNVGAGTIFCNYDGVQKHVTTLEDGVFIGSDSQLVAPVTIGEGAYVGSGSTITKDVPAGALAIARPRQKNLEGYATRLRERLAREKLERTKNDA
jgi:bifunctional UDP-N-acetylglucosamine pyrophosphorylase/glucosamine-1-phosphate N-acetyltransferase